MRILAATVTALAAVGLAACGATPTELEAPDIDLCETLVCEEPIVEPPVVSGRPDAILVDASRDGGVWWYPQAGTFEQNQPHQGQALAGRLRALGYTVYELGRDTRITDELLDRFQIVIRAGMFGTYTAAEVEAYRRYAARPDAKLVLIPHFLRDGQVDLVSASLGLPMAGMHSGAMIPVGTHALTDGVGPLAYGPGSALLPGGGAAVSPLGVLEDGRVVMGLVTDRPAGILFLGDLRLLERVPEPLVSNLVAWLGG